MMLRIFKSKKKICETEVRLTKNWIHNLLGTAVISSHTKYDLEGYTSGSGTAVHNSNTSLKIHLQGQILTFEGYYIRPGLLVFIIISLS